MSKKQEFDNKKCYEPWTEYTFIGSHRVPHSDHICNLQIDEDHEHKSGEDYHQCSCGKTKRV